jgi:peptidoglycan/LPS O-acetylase OafA/YrhL
MALGWELIFPLITSETLVEAPVNTFVHRQPGGEHFQAIHSRQRRFPAGSSGRRSALALWGARSEVKRNLTLDVLRGVAVLMVLVYHNYLIRLGYAQPPAYLNFFARGVDLFFVLSGFLISGLLFSEFKERRSIDCWRFWIRRGLKIYPAFYALMLVGFPLILWNHLSPKVFWDEIFFLQSYRPHYWPHTWSLAVEEHFYVALPLLLLLLLKILPKSDNPFRIIPVISIVLSIVCLLLRLRALLVGGGIEQYVFPTHLRIDALFAGVTLGYFYHFDKSFTDGKRWWVLACGLLLCFGCALVPYFFQLTFAYPAFAMVLAWALNQPQTWFRYLSPVAWIGRYSYSIYLWHVIAFVLMQKYLPLNGWLATYLVSSIVLGVILAKAVEMPFLRRREKIAPAARVSANQTSASKVGYEMA